MRSSWILGANSSVERRGDGLEQRALAHEADIGVDGELGGRQDAFLATAHSRGRGPRPSHSRSQRAMPPSWSPSAVMVEQPHQPLAAERRDPRSATMQRRVLHRDAALVVVAVQRPGLDLPLVELAGVQQPMERVHGCGSARRRSRRSAASSCVGALQRGVAGGGHRLELHAVMGHFPAGPLELGALGAVGEKRRVGVVDVDEDAPARRATPAQPGDRPRRVRSC